MQRRSSREHDLYKLIARYMQIQYPDVIYRFDLAADMKLTMGQAAKHKSLHPFRGYPDLFIAKAKLMQTKDGMPFIKHGLFLELKKDGVRILKRDGSYVADEHIREQAKMLESLECEGYEARFAVGFDQAKQIIDDYIGRKKKDADIF